MDCPHSAPIGRLRGPVATLEDQGVPELHVVALQIRASAVGPDPLAVVGSRRVFPEADPGVRGTLSVCEAKRKQLERLLKRRNKRPKWEFVQIDDSLFFYREIVYKHVDKHKFFSTLLAPIIRWHRSKSSLGGKNGH